MDLMVSRVGRWADQAGKIFWGNPSPRLHKGGRASSIWGGHEARSAMMRSLQPAGKGSFKPNLLMVGGPPHTFVSSVRSETFRQNIDQSNIWMSAAQGLLILPLMRTGPDHWPAIPGILSAGVLSGSDISTKWRAKICFQQTLLDTRKSVAFSRVFPNGLLDDWNLVSMCTHWNASWGWSSH